MNGNYIINATTISKEAYVKGRSVWLKRTTGAGKRTAQHILADLRNLYYVAGKDEG